MAASASQRSRDGAKTFKKVGSISFSGKTKQVGTCKHDKADLARRHEATIWRNNLHLLSRLLPSVSHHIDILLIFWHQAMGMAGARLEVRGRLLLSYIRESHCFTYGDVYHLMTKIYDPAVHKNSVPLPRTTWQKTVRSELETAHLTRGEARRAGRDRTKWKRTVTAERSTGNEED